MPVELQDEPPSVEIHTEWSSVLGSLASQTVSFGPAASHGRSPSWQLVVPRSQVRPPSGEENKASFTRSMPVLYTRPPASWVRSGSEKPVLVEGLASKPVPLRSTRDQDRPSLDVQML